MRTLLRWLVVTLGIAALVRWWRRRGESTATVVSQPVEDPADELRRKLAQSRATETAPDATPEPESSIDERRADVHAQGRAAVAEMTSGDEG